MDSIQIFFLENILGNILLYFFINIITISLLSYGIYFYRHHNRDATTAYMLFNIFAFSVITAFLHTGSELQLGFGFGLFAVLSLIRLRSEALSRTDLSYFFGSLSVALINSLNIDNIPLIIILNLFILLGAWFIDRPQLMSNTKNMKILLDHIPENLLKDPETANSIISEKFGITVLSVKITRIDQVKDTVQMRISYQDTDRST